MKKGAPIRLTVPGELRYRDVSIRAVIAACRLVIGERYDRCPAPTEEAMDLRRRFDAEVVSAFSEIFNNVVIHGYRRGGTHGEIRIEISPSDAGISIRIEDSGRSFDLEQVSAPELESLPEGGMGIHIARACLDQLLYTPGPPNVWRLTKQRRRDAPETLA